MGRASSRRTMGLVSLRQIREHVLSGNLNPAPSIRRQDGFALVAALVAAMLILALGILVIQLSTQDLRSGTVTVGGKKALAAVDTGVHRLLSNYDPAAATSTLYDQWFVVDSAADPKTEYRIGTPVAGGGTPVPLPGYSMEVGQGWGMTRMAATVSGRNSNYNTSMQVNVGMGYGPVPTGTAYR